MVRFEREAQVLASLNHPNIAEIYGVEEWALVTGLSYRCPIKFDMLYSFCYHPFA